MKPVPCSLFPVPEHNGFTIMEVMVTLGIFVLMTVLYGANFKGFQQKAALESDAEKISSSVRQLQIWALTGYILGTTRPAYGYGIHIPSPCTSGICTYTLFGDDCDTTSNGVYDAVYDSGCDILIRTETLSSSTNVAGTTPIGNMTIIFTLPSAVAYTNNTSPQNATTTLSRRDMASNTKSIVLNGSSGQVNVK